MKKLGTIFVVLMLTLGVALSAFAAPAVKPEGQAKKATTTDKSKETMKKASEKYKLQQRAQQVQQQYQTELAKTGGAAVNERDLATAKKPVRTIMDGGDFFTAQEEKELQSMMDAMNKKYDVKIAIVTYKALPGTTLQKATELMHAPVTGFTQAPNGDLLLVLNQNLKAGQKVAGKGQRKYTIKTDAKMRKIITVEKGLPYLTDELVSKLKENKFGAGARQYLEAADTCLAYYAEEGSPYDPQRNTHRGIAGAIAAMIAFLTSQRYKSVLKRKMSNVAHAVAADAYLERDTFQLTRVADNYLYSETFVTVDSSNDDDSSSSDGGCGGDSDGGGSSSGSF